MPNAINRKSKQHASNSQAVLTLCSLLLIINLWHLRREWTENCFKFYWTFLPGPHQHRTLINMLFWGAVSSSVDPLPGTWLAARMADLTVDVNVFLS